MKTVASAVALAWLAAIGTAGAVPQGRLYLSVVASNEVLIYAAPEGRAQIGVITQGLHAPGALTTDASGTLYVANGGSNSVAAFPSGAIRPKTLYTAGISSPGPLAIGPDGSLYVANQGNSTVEQFPPGATAPSRTIRFAQPPAGIAIDRDGVLFVNAGTGDILRYRPGETNGRGLGFTGIPAAGLAIDAQGNFALDIYQTQFEIIGRRPPLNVLHPYYVQCGALFLTPATGPSLFVFDSADQRLDRIFYDDGIVANIIDNLPPSVGGVAVSSR